MIRTPTAALTVILNDPDGTKMLKEWEKAWVFKGRGPAHERRAWKHARDAEERAFFMLWDALKEIDDKATSSKRFLVEQSYRVTVTNCYVVEADTLDEAISFVENADPTPHWNRQEDYDNKCEYGDSRELERKEHDNVTPTVATR